MPKTFDVCIVGSGAGGGMAAYALAKAGANVVLMEAGDVWYGSRNSKMMFPNYASPRRGGSTRLKPFGEFDGCEGGWEIDGEPYTKAPGTNFLWWRARMLGGRTNHWGRISLRFGPDDFRRKTLDGLKALNEINYREVGDPETHTRIQQYELAFRMQASVPELTAITGEPESTYALYGEDAKKPGTFANSALMARRLVERGVRFVQIYHNNWDTHSNTSGRLPSQCKDVDQACYGLIQDLKARGMLDDTLVVWGGEFGRTIYTQGTLTKENYGRDHHPRCFTMWMAGGGSKPGVIHGETDDFSYNIVKDGVHIRDFHATVLQLLGFDHERFTFRSLGLDQRLTGVEHANVVKELLA